MEYINSPQYMGLPMDPYNMQQGGFQQTQNPYGISSQSPQMIQNKPPVDPRIFETPEITMGESHKPLFTATDSNPNSITVSNDSDVQAAEKKKKKGRPRKEETLNSPIIKADGSTPALTGEVENDKTIYSYNETNAMLHETMNQIDAINVELVKEFNQVQHNRTMKNKYGVLNALSENIGAMISNRISTIKEINNCISKANDMDYKKFKDMQAAQSAMNDDKYISDIYQAMISNPQMQAQMPQMPTISDPSIMGSGIVRANISQEAAGGGIPITDAGYMNYIANLTPEQNMMRYEGNPNIKQVVVYDAASGAKMFQMMNVATGEVITNVPTYDNMIMEDTTLDLNTKIAKNINLNETFPIVVINDNITSQY